MDGKKIWKVLVWILYIELIAGIAGYLAGSAQLSLMYRSVQHVTLKKILYVLIGLGTLKIYSSLCREITGKWKKAVTAVLMSLVCMTGIYLLNNYIHYRSWYNCISDDYGPSYVDFARFDLTYSWNWILRYLVPCGALIIGCFLIELCYTKKEKLLRYVEGLKKKLQETEKMFWDVENEIGGDEELFSEKMNGVEIVKSGASAVDGSIYFAVTVRNRNTDKAAIFCKVNYTAKDKDGEILASEDLYLPTIYPGKDITYAEKGLEIEKEPEKIEITLLENGYLVDVKEMKHGKYLPLSIASIITREEKHEKEESSEKEENTEKEDTKKEENTAKSTKRMIVEFYNPSAGKIPKGDVTVSLVFVDKEGNYKGGIGGVNPLDIEAKSWTRYALELEGPVTEDYLISLDKWGY